MSPRSLAPLLALVLAACSGQIEPGATPPEEPPAPEDEGLAPPERDPIAPAEVAPGRRLRRLTADQLVASLEVATGERWADYERFAGSLGRADFAEVTEEGRELNVTFEKLASDAARATCAAALEKDLEGREPGVILHHVGVAHRDPADLAANLKHLQLRFLGVRVVDDADPRLTPWMDLLTHAPDGTPIEDATMATRWEAVCIGLATHPDFLTY